MQGIKCGFPHFVLTFSLCYQEAWRKQALIKDIKTKSVSIIIKKKNAP